MHNSIEQFIKTNREEMNTLEPSPKLWNAIETSLPKMPLIKTKFSWLKYFIFGASVIAVIVYFKMSNTAAVMPTSEHNVSQQAQLPSITHKTIAANEAKTAIQNIKEFRKNKPNVAPTSFPTTDTAEALITKPSKPLSTESKFSKIDEGATPVNKQNNNTKKNSEVTTKTTAASSHDVSSRPTAKAKNNATPISKQKTHIKTPNIKDTLKQSLKVDTLFSGIKRLEISSPFDVNVHGKERTSIAFKADISWKTKGWVVKKPVYEIKYERQDTVLKISVIGGNTVVLVGSFECNGILNFEVPKTTTVIIDDSYGDVNATELAGNIFQIKNSSGDVHLTNINTNVTAKLGYGDLTAQNIQGTNCDIQSSSGDVHLSNINAKLTAKLAYGELFARNITGATFEIHSSSGNVTLDTLKGELTLKMSYGDMIAKNIQAKTCDIQNSSGNMQLENITAELKITQTYGDITLKNIVGNITANSSSGDISANKISGNITTVTLMGDQYYQNLQGNIHINSSSGSIRVVDMKGNAVIGSSYGDVMLENFTGNPSIDVKSGSVSGKKVELTDSLNVKSLYGDIKMNLVNDYNSLSFDLLTNNGTITIDKDGQKMREAESLKLTNGKIHIKGYTASGDQTYK